MPVAQDGVPFRVDALSLDGLLVGGAGYQVAPYLTADRVGLVDAEETAVRWLPSAAPGPGRAAGTGIVAWSEVRDGVQTIVCARARDAWTPVALANGRDSSSTLRASGSAVAWTDRADRVWVSRECGVPRQVGEGEVVAFAWPAGASCSRPHDPDHPARAPRPAETTLEKELTVGTSTIDASGSALAWVDHGAARLVAVFYQGEERVLDRDLPLRDGFFDITVGRRLVVYTQRRDGPDDSRSVVIDMVTGARVELRSEAFAAGDHLAWREGDHYTVAAVR